MTKEVAKGLTRFGLLVVLTVIAASASVKAQSLDNRITANIPFDFTVANKKLPAGKYWINRAQQGSGDQIIEISRADGGSGTVHITIPVMTLRPKNKPTLLFHRYGADYFLSQVWPAGGSTGRELHKSRTERDIQQKGHEQVAMVTVF